MAEDKPNLWGKNIKLHQNVFFKATIFLAAIRYTLCGQVVNVVFWLLLGCELRLIDLKALCHFMFTRNYSNFKTSTLQ